MLSRKQMSAFSNGYNYKNRSEEYDAKAKFGVVGVDGAGWMW